MQQSSTTTEDPGTLVESAVDHCLDVAATWLAGNGRPRVSEDGDRAPTRSAVSDRPSPTGRCGTMGR